MLRILTVSQRFKTTITNKEGVIELMKDEVAEANGRITAAMKVSQTDHDTIEKLKLEIGNLG